MSNGVHGSAEFKILLVDGIDLLGAKPKTFDLTITANAQQSEGLGDSARAKLPTGLSTVTATQGGAFFSDAANGMHVSLKASTATSRIFMLALGGNSNGASFFGVSGDYLHEYGVLGKIPNLTEANVKHLLVGSPEWGRIVNLSETRAADWNTKTDGTQIDYTADPSQQVIPITSATKANPCVVTTTVPHGLTTAQKVLISGNTLAGPSINADAAVTVLSTTTFSVASDTSGSSGAGTGGSLVRSSSVGGGSGYLAVLACSGFTNFVGKIQHSSDDSSYTDLVTFADSVTAPSAQRVTVAGTIKRYLCFDGDITGTGSLTLCCGFSRS